MSLVELIGWIVLSPFYLFLYLPFRLGLWMFTTTFKVSWFMLTAPFKLWSLAFGEKLPEFENTYQRERYLRVKRHFRRKRNFQNHALFFVFILTMTMLSIATSPFGGSVAYEFFVAWGFLLGFHYYRMKIDEQEDDALLGTLKSLYSEEIDPDFDEKRKRVSLSELLTEDGELWEEAPDSGQSSRYEA